MIINYDSPGQLCNRIWSLVPSIAYGLEYNEKVLIINFDEYSGDFDNLNKNQLIRFASRRLLKKFIHSLKVRGYVQNGRSNMFSRLFKLNFIEGWSNRLGNAEMVIKQAVAIRKIFSFKPEIKAAVEPLMKHADDEVIVGVHIRRGDYDVWLNGIYYYTDDDYLRIMKSLVEQFEEKGKKVKFLLCSNEQLNLNNFKDLNIFIIPESSGAKDLYGLSKCTHIIGPPSSYSEWASFFGEVPIKYILSKNEDIKLGDFSKMIAFNKFANGEQLIID